MNARRILGSLLATTMAATALVAGTVATAEADTTYQTRIVGYSGPAIDRGYQSQPGVTASGTSLYISVKVEANIDGAWTRVYDGAVTVQRRLAGSSTWSTLGSGSSGSAFVTTKAVKTAAYRYVYAGANVTYPTTATYQGLVASQTVPVQRAITSDVRSGRLATYHGKIKPRAGKAVIQIKKSKHGKWKKFKRVSVKKNGAWTVKVTGPRKGVWYYRVVVSAGGGFSKSTSAVTGIIRRTF